MIGRREFITLLAGAAATWPLVAWAQQLARVPRIGIVDNAPMWHSFRQALRELGYVEGHSVNYEYRYAEGVPDRLASVTAELVRRPVDLIAVYGTPPTEAAKAATTTIPIVMIGVGDPVRAGLVASLARPGGNVTGNTVLSPALGAKRLQLLRDRSAQSSKSSSSSRGAPAPAGCGAVGRCRNCGVWRSRGSRASRAARSAGSRPIFGCSSTMSRKMSAWRRNSAATIGGCVEMVETTVTRTPRRCTASTSERKSPSPENNTM